MSKKGKNSDSGANWKGGNHTVAASCHHSHPVLKLGKGTLRGGSCGSPADGFDIYIGFDGWMKSRRPYPWEPQGHVIEFSYPISDGRAPSDAKSFKKMVTWIVEQLNDGKNVHMGCIGGHGRTGTVLAAVVNELTGEEDAIKWVREHHCKKAVETTDQIDFLHKHYGITKAEPTKTYKSSGGSQRGFWGGSGQYDAWGAQKSTYKQSSPIDWDKDDYETPAYEAAAEKQKIFAPIASSACIWAVDKRKRAS